MLYLFIIVFPWSSFRSLLKHVTLLDCAYKRNGRWWEQNTVVSNPSTKKEKLINRTLICFFLVIGYRKVFQINQALILIQKFVFCIVNSYHSFTKRLPWETFSILADIFPVDDTHFWPTKKAQKIRQALDLSAKLYEEGEEDLFKALF